MDGEPMEVSLCWSSEEEEEVRRSNPDMNRPLSFLSEELPTGDPDPSTLSTDPFLA